MGCKQNSHCMKKLYLFWLYAVTLLALATASLSSMIDEKRLLAETTSRLSALSTSIEDSIIINYHMNRLGRISKIVKRLSSNSEVVGLTICDLTAGKVQSFPAETKLDLLCQNPVVTKLPWASEKSWTSSRSSDRYKYLAHSLENNSLNPPQFFFVLTQDVSYLRTEWIRSFLKIFLGTWIGASAILFLVASQVRKWGKEQLRMLRNSKIIKLRSKNEDSEPNWLKSLKNNIHGQNLIVVANREPYIHQKKDGKIQVVRPASGLVTALEPILRQMGGLWIAHGSGSADVETSNSRGEVKVPPQHPTYTLRRVALTKEEEMGYYYGFSNEGLWPLCHLAHNRPNFRLSDWEYYQLVNQRFTQAVPAEFLSEKSLILVQDYHFALLPRFIRERAPKSGPKIGLFWHIPWPNPEAFGICPWNQKLLKGMLGSDIIGFHTQYHCNNFLETCNRYLEARIDWEKFSVTMDHHETQVKAFPIGIDPSPVKTLSDTEVDQLKKSYGIYSEIVAVGVDRLDYTKGLIERVSAVERFLEKYPSYIGRFSLVQMGSPSRTHIPAYRLLAEQLEEEVNRVNQRFGKPESNPPYQPIIFLHEHHEWEDIKYFYQMGNVCLVTSLHDGMNLVAKEYVWCQRSDRGSLILSKFTGASRELTESFIVNPYSIEEMADALAAAISLPQEEKSRRMNAMKEKVEQNSALHWASDLIQSLLIKTDLPSSSESKKAA